MARRKCHYCDRPARWLCDYRVHRGPGGVDVTCDRPLCDGHRVNVGVIFMCGKDGCLWSRDVCPGHDHRLKAGRAAR